jgi:hypothetical protein
MDELTASETARLAQLVFEFKAARATGT